MDFPIDPILLKKYRESVDLTNFPKGFVKWYEQAGKDEIDRWYIERFLCLKYHLYLAGFTEEIKTGDPELPKSYVPIMGMDFQKNPHEVLFAQYIQKRPGENIVLTDLDTLTKKRMILWPRGVFKTSSIIVEIVQCILNYPNIRICFLTGGHKLAKRQLMRVKKVFERPTKRFKFLFPEFCLISRPIKKRKKRTDDDELVEAADYEDVTPKFGTTEEFTVPARTNDTFAEPTFAISTAKSVNSGSHFDMMFIDDLVHDKNFKNPDALEKCYQDYLDISPVLDPMGFMIVTGTRYSFGDTYERLQQNAKKEEQKFGRTIWKFSIRNCWALGCQNCIHTDVYHAFDKNIAEAPCAVEGCSCPGFKARGNKDVLFPRARTHDGREIGHTLEWLEQEQIRVGPEFFANQYENCPISTDSQTFTETLIGAQTLHHINQLPTYYQGPTIVVGDLAYVAQKDRDFSVLYVCRIYQGQIFVIACEYGNWDADAIAENTLKVLLVHRPTVLYYEKYNAWEAYDNVIKAKAKDRQIEKVPIEWVKGSQSPNAKLTRIGAVKGPLSQKRLWLFAGMQGYQLLVEQLCKWPKLGRHDDFADCLGQVVAAPTGYEQGTPPVTQSMGNWLQKLHQSKPLDDEYGDNGCGTGLCC